MRKVTSIITLLILSFYCSKSLAQATHLNTNGINVVSLVATDNFILFATVDESRVYDLWRTNGTQDGTILLKNNFIIDWNGNNALDENNIIYFSANDGIHGFELWRSDGTIEGTELVKDIAPGNSSGSPSNIVFLNGKLYFSANVGELWESDGTKEGTQIIKKIGLDYNSPLEYLTVVKNSLFFSADDGTYGRELWKSDGTEQGTNMIKDINPGEGSSYLTRLVEKDDEAFFFANDDINGLTLWKSDGTINGTKQVKDINVLDENHTVSELICINNKLFFSGTNEANGSELWISDGTMEGTELLKDINPGTNSSTPKYFVENKDELYFVANDGTHGYELWKSNGTFSGTTLVKDINNGSYNSNPQILISVKDTLYFVAGSSTSRDLWKSDGTIEGTQMVFNLYPDSTSSTILDLNFTSNYIYFIGDDYSFNDYSLWSFRCFRAQQSIKFDSIELKTYGDIFDLNAKSSSLLDVSYSNTDTNVATISGSQVNVVGVGSTTITAFQNGNEGYYGTQTQRTLTVKKADLIAVADNMVKIPGTENPEFSISYSGFVNDETVEEIDTLPTISCNATIDSPIGEYEILLSGGSDNNYEINKQSGILEISFELDIENVSNSKIKAYPNPVNNKLFINYDKDNLNGIIRIYDLSGEIIYCCDLTEKETVIDFSSYRPGLYLLRTTNQNESLIIKIIKN